MSIYLLFQNLYSKLYSTFISRGKIFLLYKDVLIQIFVRKTTFFHKDGKQIVIILIKVSISTAKLMVRGMDGPPVQRGRRQWEPLT